MRISLSLVLALMIQSTHLGKDQRMDLFQAREGFESFKSKYLPKLLIPKLNQITSDDYWAFEYYIGVQELCLDLSLPDNQTDGM